MAKSFICNYHLYVAFVAIKGDDVTDAWQDNEDTFLRIALPYEEVLKRDVRGLMTDYLIKNLEKLTWLDYESLRHQLKRKLNC